MRGISKVIEVILVLIITISLIFFVYQWSLSSTSATQQNMQKNLAQNQGCLKIENIDLTNKKITIRNCGGNDISNFIVYLDSGPFAYYTSVLVAGGITQISYTGNITIGNHEIFVSSNYAETNKIVFSVHGPCDFYIHQSNMTNTYSITQSNKIYCLAENVYIGGKNAINFSLGVYNTTLDCQSYNIDGNDYSNTYGVYLTGASTKSNTVENCNITDFYNGIYLYNGPNNNILSNNIVNRNYNGIFLTTAYSNNIIGGSTSSSSNADYYLVSLGGTTNFTNTNFTAARTIYFNDSSSWFNYQNDSSQNIWLKTSVSTQSTITRKLVNWNNTLIKWNDTFSNTSGSITVTYNVSGLTPSTKYNVYNNSILIYKIISNSNGEINFTINLPSNQQNEIKVQSGVCDYNLFSSDIPYTITQNNSLYCLAENVNIIDKIIGQGVLYHPLPNNENLGNARCYYNYYLGSSSGCDNTYVSASSGYSGSPPVPDTMRGIIKFNLSSIPSGAKIRNAALTLFVTSVPTPPCTYTVDVYNGSSQNWDESNVKWNDVSGANLSVLQDSQYVITQNTPYNWGVTNAIKTAFASGSNAILIIKYSAEYQPTFCEADFLPRGYTGYLARPYLTISYDTIAFDIGVQNSSFDCRGYSIAGSNSDYGVYLSGPNGNSIIKNCSIINFNNGIDIESNNNTIINNGITNNSRGVVISSSSGNNITGGSIFGNIYDYFLSLAGTTNNFTNTNFTAARTIYFNDSSSWFNYQNDSSQNIWLKTSVSTQSTITRKLVNWNNTLIKWNDTFSNTSGSITVTYNVSGLTSNINYAVYNNAVLAYILNSSSSGQISFTINLPAGQEHMINVGSFDEVLWFRFSEGSGTKAFDSSNYHNDGTFYGETFNDGTFYGETFNNGNSYSGSTPTDLHTTSGIYGSALSFDGQNDYVNTTSTTLFISTPFTVSFWMNPKTIGGNNPPNTGNSTWVVSNSWNWFFEYWNSGNFEFKSGSGGASTTITNTNSWYYITGIYNGTHYILYVNGNYVSAGTGGVGTASYPILIGSGLCGSGTGCWNGYFNGTIDEVRIWNRSLSQAEISANMQSSLPTSRPIASYSFEEPIGATYVNDTHIWVNGTYGSALSFDGVNDYVNLGNNSVFNPRTNSFTVSAWFKTNGLVGSWTPQDYQHCIYYKNKNMSMNGQGFYLDIGGKSDSTRTGKAECFIFDENPFFIKSTLRYDDGIWHHISCSVNRTGNATLYVDGQQVATQLISSLSGRDYNTIYNASIGNDVYGNCRFNGTIDEVRVYMNRSLTQTEVQAERQSSLPVQRPVASYRFEERYGQYANDTHIWVNGTYGSALSFNGVNDYVSLPDSSSLNITSNSITLSAWVKFNSFSLPTNTQVIILKADGSTTAQLDYGLRLQSGVLNFALGNGTNELDASLTALPSVGVWHYLTGTFNGTHALIYLDGVLNSSSSSPGFNTIRTSTGASGYPPTIGNFPQSSQYFNGTIDEVRIWNRALSQAEIQAEMNKG